jgi:hypothetical protein
LEFKKDQSALDFGIFLRQVSISTSTSTLSRKHHEPTGKERGVSLAEG